MTASAPSLAAELAEIATGGYCLSTYRREALDLLQRRIGFDLGTVQNPVAGATGRGFALDDAALTEFQASCVMEFTPFEIQRMCCGRTSEIRDVFSSKRLDELSVYAFLGRPRTVLSFISSTRVGSAGVVLARTGRASSFSAEVFGLLDAAAAVLAVAECLFTLEAHDPLRAWAEEIELTARQFEIADLVVRGLRNVEIAAVLRCSELTIRNHLVAVFQKAGVTTRSEVVFQALTYRGQPQARRGYAYFDQHAKAALGGAQKQLGHESA